MYTSPSQPCISKLSLCLKFQVHQANPEIKRKEQDIIKYYLLDFLFETLYQSDFKLEFLFETLQT